MEGPDVLAGRLTATADRVPCAWGGMMCEPTKVLVYTRESSAPYRARLIDSANVCYLFCESEEDVAAHVRESDVVLGSVAFPARLLKDAERLRWIQVTGAGVDAFLAQGELPVDILLTRVDTSFGEQVAEYVVAHLLAHVQRVRDVYRLQAQKRWEPLERKLLTGRTIGIAGTGAIGQVIAQRARGIGTRTVGLSRTGGCPEGFDVTYGPRALRAFLCELDVLVLCLPLTPETRGLIGGDELASLKRSAILVNVARGAVVDEPALIEALRAGRLAGAILDVFADEPLPVSSPLWAMENVTITSHHAGLNAPDEIIDYFLENLERFRTGVPLRGLVDPQRGY